jgi:hypothetical protein
MGKVTVRFSEEDYKLFRHYCSNYCRLYDESRKNSIKILLELYKHHIIDFQENNLDNVYAFFYQKKQDFEIEYRVPESSANEMMRIRACIDIISFLGDLEKIFVLLKRKGVNANYLLIISAFSTIFDEETQIQRENFQKAASEVINSIVLPLGYAIESKFGPNVDTRTILEEFVRFAETFNRISPDQEFNDEIIEIIAWSLIRRFNKAESYDDLKILVHDLHNQFDIDEFESALDGGLNDKNEWDLEFSWENLQKSVRELAEMIEKDHNLTAVPLDVLSALEAPMTSINAPAEFSQIALYQYPYRGVRKRVDENRFLVQVDNSAQSEVHLSSPADFISPKHAGEEKYKQYFSLTSGIMMILIILLTCFVFSFYSAPGNLNGNTTSNMNVTKNLTNVQSVPVQNISDANRTYLTVNKSPIKPVATPSPAAQYVIIRPEVTVAVSPKIAYDIAPFSTEMLHNTKEYTSIFKNNLPYLGYTYNISFDLKNPPMVIRYTVTPMNITDTKWFSPRDNEKIIDSAVVERPAETAYFTIKIYHNGMLHDTVGWGTIYPTPLTPQMIVIRDTGMTDIEFSGEQVTVSTEVFVKKEGNIPV